MLSKIDDDPSFHHKIIFTDETMVMMETTLNRQNDRDWQENQPYNFHQHSVWSNNAMAWSGINHELGTLGTYWLPRGGVNQNVYQNLLTERVFPYFDLFFDEDYIRNNFIFMQDGAPAHKTNESILVIRTHFNQIISLGCDIEWPPNSPDLNPIDFWFWNQVKDKSVMHQNLEDAKSSFENRMENLKDEEIQEAIDSFPGRLQACLAANGGHFVYH